MIGLSIDSVRLNCSCDGKQKQTEAEAEFGARSLMDKKW